MFCRKEPQRKTFGSLYPCPQDLELEFSYFPASFKIYTSSHSNTLKTPNHTVVKAQTHFLEPQWLTKGSRVLLKRHPGSYRVWPRNGGLASLSHLFIQSTKAKEHWEFSQEKIFKFCQQIKTEKWRYSLGKLSSYLELATDVGWTYIFISRLIRNKTLKFIHIIRNLF